MEFLNAFFVAPFVDIFNYPIFFAEVVIAGVLTGVMYSLVALGFVLIFGAVGAIIAAGRSEGSLVGTILGTAALVAAAINVVGGYLVTDRMLGMFKRKEKTDR